MKRSLVYLAGPIAGTKGGEAFSWRQDAAFMLDNRGDIDVLDLMRAKSGLGPGPISENFNDYSSKGVFFTSRGIMLRDFTDVKRADAILVNLLGATKPSLGTVMELGWAYAMQNPVVVAIERHGNPHDNHPMIHEAMPFRVETLDEAVDAIAFILGR